MVKSYRGSCHCGAVRFECELDLAQGTGKCNCSFCTKARFWEAEVKAEAFRLLSGADVLTEYRFGSGALRHLHCSRCGMRPFGQGRLDAPGSTDYAINLACLDDVSPTELLEAPVRYMDGRHDRWESPPAETGHL